ncbi:hypothetical protein ZIOFF_062961 [Zingiber officinale]|uniref:glutaredoxin-dependent peroxiredoxin n=1 Tax=Zingiber officinale TaxID=94328 RepID=A0A8J5F161_ZINOF|nr:hypothetical protein ZIOFF_062961 [Zingiber officinale]
MCSQEHLPRFVEKDGELHAKGVDTIACISVNDASVMHAWKKDLNIRDKVLLLSDGNREFTLALGVELDLNVGFSNNKMNALFQVAAKRTNVPGLKQFRPLRHNPYPMYSYRRSHMPS